MFRPFKNFRTLFCPILPFRSDRNQDSAYRVGKVIVTFTTAQLVKICFNKICPRLIAPCPFAGSEHINSQNHRYQSEIVETSITLRYTVHWLSINLTKWFQFSDINYFSAVKRKKDNTVLILTFHIHCLFCTNNF